MRTPEEIIAVIMREVLIFWAAVFIFPFKTVRLLIWKWYKWLAEGDKLIAKEHEEYFEIVNKHD